jgi:anti-anti-sigma regulatory factor
MDRAAPPLQPLDDNSLGHHCPHWHQVGRQWRPLHEQLATLHDANVWAAVSSPLSTPDSHHTSSDSSARLACVQHGGEYAALTVTGAITGRSVYWLRVQLRSLLDAGVPVVVIDLSAVTAADVRLAAMLETAWSRIRTRHGELVLLNIAIPIQPLLLNGPLRSRATFCGTPSSTLEVGQEGTDSSSTDNGPRIHASG